MNMLKVVRRLEFLYLRGSGVRARIGNFVELELVSCQHHDSNLFDTHVNRKKRVLDETRPDPFNQLAAGKIAGNKSTECWAYNKVRFLADNFKKYKDFKAFMLSNYGDDGGIAPIKSSRFWAVRA